MKRLFGCTVQLIYKDENVDATVNAVIADHTVFWWNERKPDQPSLWESKIQLSEPFFNEIINHRYSRSSCLSSYCTNKRWIFSSKPAVSGHHERMDHADGNPVPDAWVTPCPGSESPLTDPQLVEHRLVSLSR